MSVKKIKQELAAAICSVFTIAFVLCSSTYAWYVNSTQVTATSLQVTSAASYSLLIKQAEAGSVYAKTTQLNGNRILVPVSTRGELVQADAPKELSDGTTVETNDVRFVKSNLWGSDGVESFTEIGKNSLSYIEDENGNNMSSKMYYNDSVYLLVGQRSKIYFDNTSSGIYDSATDVLHSFTTYTEIPITSGMTDSEKRAAEENNKIVALLKTMRVGFLITQNEGTPQEETNFYVYQFLADEISSTGSYSTTRSTDSGDAVEGVRFAAGPSGVGDLKTFICNTINDGIPVVSDCMADGKENGISTVYNEGPGGRNSQALALANANEEIKVDIYFWMEGCDFDNTAANSEEFATSISGIQFGFCLGTAA